MGEIGPEDLIYYSDKEGGIYSGGFNINSIMMKKGISPIMTFNTENILGGSGANNVSDLFDNLVIPNWALAYPNKNKYNHTGGNTEYDTNINTSENYQSDINSDDLNMSDTDDEIDTNKKYKEDEKTIIDDDLYNKLLDMTKVSEEEIKRINNVSEKAIEKASEKASEKAIDKDIIKEMKAGSVSGKKRTRKFIKNIMKNRKTRKNKENNKK